MRRFMAAVLLGALVVGAGTFTGCTDDQEPAPVPMLSREELQDPQACASCHPDHYREWSGSMHAYAGVDPVFLALNKRMQRETNGAAGNFCVQCHAPMAVRAGATTDGLNLDKLDPKLLGVNCYFCHSAQFIGGPLHNNPLTLSSDGKMSGGIKNPVPNTAHGAQYSTFQDRTDDSSALVCGTCHDIVNPLGANIERTFVEWRRSHFATEQRQTCGTCHMPERTGLAAQAPGVLVRKVHDHSMPGVDIAAIAIAFPEKDAQRAGVQKSLDDAISAKLCVTSGGATGVRVDVTLRSEKVGHGWPSGAAQDRRAWVELEGFLAGAMVFSSGQVPVDKAVSATADAQIMLLRDQHFDAADRETKLFWQTVRFTSVQLPVARSSSSPETDGEFAHAYTFAGPMPDSVKMRVKIRPVDFDLLDETRTVRRSRPEARGRSHVHARRDAAHLGAGRRLRHDSAMTQSADDHRLAEELAFLEAAQVPAIEHREVRLLRDVLGDELAHHRRHHEAVPHEAGRLVEVLDRVDAADDRVRVGREVVAAGPLAQHLHLAEHRARRDERLRVEAEERERAVLVEARAGRAPDRCRRRSRRASTG